MTWPLVSVLLSEGRVHGVLIGRLTRVEGRPVAAEVAVPFVLKEQKPITLGADNHPATFTKYTPMTRYTLVPIAYVTAINAEAEAMMEDDGHPEKKSKAA